jgi:hypothetical protein
LCPHCSCFKTRKGSENYKVEDPGQVEKTEVVTFQQDQQMEHYEKPRISYNKFLQNIFIDGYGHDIKTFLATPIKFTTQLLSTTDAKRQVLLTVGLPGLFYTNPSYAMWRNKWQGMRFTRYTVVIKFLVNANKGDIGRYLASWEPYGQESSYNPWLPTLCYNKGLPNVEITVGPQKSAEMRIPWVSPYTALDTLITNSFYGRLRVTTMIPMESVIASNSCDLDIWFSLEDIEISTRTTTTGAGSTLPTVDPYTVMFPPLPPPESLVVINKESGSELMSGIMDTAGKILGSAVSKEPAPIDIKIDPSWIGKAAKGALSMIGFSKPRTEKENRRITNIPGFGFTNVDTIDQSVTIGATHGNTLGFDPEIFGTKQDEMDINYICSKMCYLYDFPWEVTYLSNRILSLIAVSPGITPDESTSYTDSQFDTTPMNFVASIFEYWTGSIKFRLSAVKNDFYSGRLQIVFFPGIRPNQVGTEGSPLTFDWAYAHRIVWDISTVNDIVFTVPYNATTPWLRSCMDKYTNKTVDSVFSLGTLAIVVDTQLRYVESVCPPRIHLIVETCAGPDLKFGCPDFARYRPMLDNPSVLITNESTLSELTFDEDDQTFYGVKTKVGHAMLYNSPMDRMDLTGESYTMGESITNLRPLTRRFGFTNFENDYGAQGTINLDPLFFGSSAEQLDAQTPIGYIASLYRFARGGVRYKFLYQKPSTGTPQVDRLIVYSQLIVSTPPSGYTTPVRPVKFGSFQHIFYPSITPVMEVTCPYYSNAAMAVLSTTPSLPQKSRMIYAAQTVPAQGVGVDNMEMAILKAAADDFTFGFMLGSRPVARTNT